MILEIIRDSAALQAIFYTWIGYLLIKQILRNASIIKCYQGLH